MASTAEIYPGVEAERALSLRRGLLSWSGPQIPAWAIVVVGAGACGVFAHYLAAGKTKYAVAIVLAAVFTPVAFFNLAAALAVWGAVLYVQDLHALSQGPNALGVLVGLGWLGAFAARSGRFSVLKGHRGVLVTVFLFAVWITLSAAWAQSPGTAGTQAGYYWLAAAVLLVVLTTVRTSREATIVALAFVIGGVLAAVVGLASGGLSTTTATAQTTVSGRLTGGGGDPNLQAAAFVASIFVTVGLFSLYRSRGVRILLTLAVTLITIAFFATESRGGLIALAVAAIVAIVVSPRVQRRRIIGLVLLMALIAVVALGGKHGALSRITDLGGGTSGRNDIWGVAAMVFKQHPIIGVGANNFSVVEPNYALDLRNATYVGYIAETPLVIPAHNSYLQMLADLGIVGLVAYLAAILACLRSYWQAVRLFDRTGRPAHAQLARACLMGTIGFLTAIFFITDGWDWRLWMLLGLGPALLTLARRTAPVPDHAPPAREAAGHSQALPVGA